ncbi:MAG: DUF2079 domain-containing protein [Flavobacteriales bacterium]
MASLHGPAAGRGWMKFHRPALAVSLLFAVLHALQFVPNHWLFRTFALDLGLYTHVAYEYAHGRMADCTLFLRTPQPILADHFDLHLMLWAPLTYLFGTWTLLIVQWTAIILGGWGMYRWLLALGGDRTLAVLGQVHFLLFFGIYSALAFDFHSNVVATMALPWYGLAVEQRRIRRSWWLLLFILAAKENMGLWTGAVALGLAWPYRRDRRLLQVLLGHAMASFAWSGLIIGWVMPSLSAQGHYAAWKYPMLGSDPVEGFRTLLFHPGRVLSVLFTDTSGMPDGRAIKIEMLLLLLLSGGWAFIRRPWILFMAAPILLQKLLHADPMVWGVFGQYSIEFAPLCTLAVFGLLLSWRRRKAALAVGVLSIIASLSATIHTMDGSVFIEERSRQRIYQQQHYERDLDVAQAHAIIDGIPDDATVSAQSPLLPWVALRPKVYEFPIVRDARYLLLLPRECCWGITPPQRDALMDTLQRSTAWRPVALSDAVVLYQRIDGDPSPAGHP